MNSGGTAPQPRKHLTAGVWMVGGFLLLASALTVRSATGGLQENFPHEDHAGLFPLCSGCHAGIESGDPATAMPEAALCGRCHDGEELETVDWEPPGAAPSLLVFDHQVHDSIAVEDALGCAGCHGEPGAPRMAVREASAETCLGCHAHEAPDHLAGASCGDCHRPVADLQAPLARALGFPEPASHDAEEFLAETHGSLAAADPVACATCHTRERCTSCHVATDPDGVIAAVPASPAAPLPPVAATYPEPADHDEDWLVRHGQDAGVESCGACHARESCTSCHQASTPPAAASMVSALDSKAPGVPLTRTSPPSHFDAGFLRAHGPDAAADPASCAGCHTRVSCEQCHTGPADPVFHDANYADRHAFDAYAARLECQNCHDAARFCRDCHAQSGLVAEGRPGRSYHDAEPLWLLRHGQAARQTLESCAGCHVQKDCVRCHSEVGAFGVNPHGPTFDPGRAATRNSRICLECHIRNPILSNQ